VRTLGPLALAVALAHAAPAAAASEGDTPARDAGRVLRVCADPNNLPFSNSRGEGFENALARLFARELGARVEYFWWAQHRGFFRNTLRARNCDVVMGVPASLELVERTSPVYRSTYAFVVRRGSGLRPTTFDDPALRRARIGVHVIGDDYANTPPVHALSQRGIVDNVVGYRLLGDYREESPPARLVEAVAAGDVDVAIVWGPFAGWFAPRQKVPLEVMPVGVDAEGPLTFAFDMSLGLRRGEPGLKAELEEILARRRSEITRILREHGVPLAQAANRSDRR
jgi:mxaJ protein